MENRNGLAMAAEATLATGTAEREAAARLSQRLPKGATLGADKGYDAEAFVEGLKARGIEPHIAINGTVSKRGKARKTAVPGEVAASLRYAVSQRLRKRIEEGFGWTKTVGGLVQVKVRGLAKVRAAFIFASPFFATNRGSSPQYLRLNNSSDNTFCPPVLRSVRRISGSGATPSPGKIR